MGREGNMENPTVGIEPVILRRSPSAAYSPRHPGRGLNRLGSWFYFPEKENDRRSWFKSQLWRDSAFHIYIYIIYIWYYFQRWHELLNKSMKRYEVQYIWTNRSFSICSSTSIRKNIRMMKKEPTWHQIQAQLYRQVPFFWALQNAPEYCRFYLPKIFEPSIERNQYTALAENPRTPQIREREYPGWSETVEFYNFLFASPLLFKYRRSVVPYQALPAHLKKEVQHT